MPEPLTPILSTLVQHKQDAADVILDLELASRERQKPGACVAAYFRIMSDMPETCRPLVKELREWLESQVEVIATDGNRQLERLPARLEGDGLEDYCEGVMREFRDNRVYKSDIHLSFAFKDSA
jgi:hypothetical protein